MNILFIALLVLLVTACKEDNKKQAQPAPTPRPSPTQPPTTTPPQATGWQFAYGRFPRDLAVNGNEVSFSFDGSEPHMLLKTTGPLAGNVRMTWRCEGCAVAPRQGSTATASFIFVRRGNNWSIDGDQANYRWYHAGRAIAGGGTMEVALQPQYWTNVLGQQNAAGFAAALANAEFIGLAFGDPGAGATAHGVTGTGKFTFTFEVAP